VTREGVGSATAALTRSLLVGLTLLWLVGVVGSGFVLQRLIDTKSDDEMRESGAILMSLIRHTDDLLITAAVMGDTQPPEPSAASHDRFVYQVRDGTGRLLLRSHHSPPQPFDVPLREGLTDAPPWRVLTLADPARQRWVHFADPLAERRDALVEALLWLMLPLAGVLGFAVYIVWRASRSLTRQVRQTALAVSRQDPQALGLLPLSGVVTEMRPAVEATNRLIGRLADALESERSFTYNSAHELRTPIAAALAQAQLLAASTAGAADEALAKQAGALVASLTRLTRLAERLLALARAEGAEPLTQDWVDLSHVARLVADEFARDSRLAGRQLVVQVSPVRVRGDLDAIGLALRNLVENAVVHATAATTIRVACGSGPDGAFVAVIDDGPGVGAEELPRLAKRFARGRQATGQGAGLGLSIVQPLARRLGATLALASPARGARSGFEARLTWPASAVAGTRPAPARRST
jgi:two-component system OmpR family sensor kinase